MSSLWLTAAMVMTSMDIIKSKKGKRIRGEIVDNIHRRWRYNDNEIYNNDENNMKEWKYLQI